MNEIDRPRVERIKHQLACFTRDADQDDRHGQPGHLFLDESQAPHAGHDQIERHNIRVQALDQGQCLFAVASGSDNLDKWTAAKHLLDDFPNIRRVVDNQNTEDSIHTPPHSFT